MSIFVRLTAGTTAEGNLDVYRVVGCMEIKDFERLLDG